MPLFTPKNSLGGRPPLRDNIFDDLLVKSLTVHLQGISELGMSQTQTACRLPIRTIINKVLGLEEFMATRRHCKMCARRYWAAKNQADRTNQAKRNSSKG